MRPARGAVRIVPVSTSASRARRAGAAAAPRRRISAVDITPPPTPAIASGQVHSIPVSAIHVGLNPREHFDPNEMDKLAASIKENGLLQPITVREHEGGYQIIAGERRFRAVQQLGETHVSAIIRNVDDKTAHELALVENLSRADMQPVETAKAFAAMMERNSWTVKQVASQTGQKPAFVETHLAVLKIDPYLQPLVNNGTIRMTLVKPISELNIEHQRQVADYITAPNRVPALSAIKALITRLRAAETQTEMFPTERVPTARSREARAKYEAAAQALTEAFSKLDRETIRAYAQHVDNPAREALRIRTMLKQLRDMQREFEAAGHAQAFAGIGL